MKHLFRSCHSISTRFRSWLWLGHSKVFILCFLTHSEEDLLVCFGSLSCCRTQMCFSSRSQTDSRTFSFRMFWSLAEFMFAFTTASLLVLRQQNSPDCHTSSTIYHCWYDVPFLKCCVTFTPDAMGHTPSRKFNLCLVSPHSHSLHHTGLCRYGFFPS